MPDHTENDLPANAEPSGADQEATTASSDAMVPPARMTESPVQREGFFSRLMGTDGPPTAREVYEKEGNAQTLIALIIGLLTGAAVYFLGDVWLENSDDNRRLIATLILGVCSFSLSLLFLLSPGKAGGAIGASALIAAVLMVPTYTVWQAEMNSSNLDSFPLTFWMFLGLPLCGYIMLALARTFIVENGRLPYATIFLHGLTMPLIAGGAKLIALLTVLLLYAWAGLLKKFDVRFFIDLFGEGWFMMPFVGAVGGASLAMMRNQQAVLSALRFLLLLLSRILMPITAVFSVTLLLVFALKGTGVLYEIPKPSQAILALSAVAMLIFNGVYQNGQSAPPPAWLRLSTLLSLITLPVYLGLAVYAIWLRVDQYGLTPQRLYAAISAFLLLGYSLICLIGVLSEINWKAKRWMAPIGPLNTLMAVIWLIVLWGLSSPVFNSWKLSAENLTAKLLAEEIDAKDFDYGYLKFKLGSWGEKALTSLEQQADSHPDAEEIKFGIAQAREARRYYYYERMRKDPTYKQPIERNRESATAPAEPVPTTTTTAPTADSPAPAQPSNDE